MSVGDEQAELGRQGPVAADAVRGPVVSGRHQPGTRIVRDTVSGPPVGGDGERLLRGFLGEVEVAEKADEGRDDAAPVLAEGLVERRYHALIGRTSIAPPSRAAGTRDATSIAASRSPASRMK